MAAVERFIVAQGWHMPRWRTTNKDYGNFYQQRHQSALASKEPLQHLDAQHPPHLHHVVDYINCNDRCSRPRHLRQHPGSVGMPSISSLCRENESLGPPFLRSCAEPAHHQGPGLNAHIQHLTLQEERSPTICGSEHFPCMQSEHADDPRDVSSVDERPPWKPKPLKPMILFEKKAKELEKERSLDRQTPYKRKKSGEWLQAPSPPSKRQQINYDVLREAQYTQGIHPATRRYNYYKYYGYGGQGAKTSWGHNRPLGQKPPFSKRTRELVV
ncbi:hypothetical protein GOP47_0014743 [Adiantum capillus-veneris]|uniref:Uncharacterized protein n=1 Tax=Adiantum capillus-veneris TaxID=13818 RepID=A0A9D4UMA8_ADICA|nr:hypothetical protein GOP47_0014743 [Adiantum capillus-veneris]